MTLLSSIYRSLLVASHSTTTIIRNMSYIKETVEKLLLPDFLCQYVETLGYYKMATGITVIPFIRSYDIMKLHPNFVDPLTILVQMDKPNPGTDWSIDDEVVLQYKKAISRVLKNAVRLRLVNNAELEAKPEFKLLRDVTRPKSPAPRL